MRKWLAALAVSTALAGARPAFAEAPADMSLADALRDGARSGPGVAVAAAPGAGFAAAKDASRGLLVMPPVVTLGAGPRVSPGTTLELQAAAMAEVPLRSVQGAREDAAKAALDATRADTKRARADAALRAGLAWSQCVQAKEVLRLRHEWLDQSEAIAEIAKKRTTAGVAMPSELASAMGDVGLARASLLDAEGTLVEVLAELRLATGRGSDARVDPSGDLYAEPAALAGPATQSAAVRAAEAQGEAARRETTLVGATLGPSLGLGASFTREGTGASIVLGLVSIPVPLVDHAAFERARAQARQDAALAAVQRTKAEAATQLALALHDVQHQREVRDTLAKDALPPLREALRIATVQYSTGAQDVGLVLVARQRVVTSQELLARTAGEVLRAELRLAHARGSIATGDP